MVGKFERLIYSINTIDREWHKIATEEMKKYDLKGPYAIYLISLNRHPDGLTAAKLCDFSGRNKADVSRAMADMEAKGLVVRENTGNSRYRSKLLLTDAGKEAAKKVTKKAESTIEFCGKDLSEECRTAFYNTLESVAKNLYSLNGGKDF